MSIQGISCINIVAGEGWAMPLMWDYASHRKLGVEMEEQTRSGQLSCQHCEVNSDYDGTWMSSFIQTSNLKATVSDTLRTTQKILCALALLQKLYNIMHPPKIQGDN